VIESTRGDWRTLSLSLSFGRRRSKEGNTRNGIYILRDSTFLTAPGCVSYDRNSFIIASALTITRPPSRSSHVTYRCRHSSDKCSTPRAYSSCNSSYIGIHRDRLPSSHFCQTCETLKRELYKNERKREREKERRIIKKGSLHAILYHYMQS